LLEKLFYYLQGYLILELCGESKERFINLCKNRKIEIIHIFLINNTWFCKIKCSDYKKIRGLIRKTGCSCRIKEKRGLPFLINKLKKRKGLLIGSVFFLLIITQCSGRIWHISVEGGFLHTREQMMKVMKQELGVYAGVPSGLVDCFEIEKQLRLDYNEIGWISVEKRGCCLFVRLNESTMPKTVDTGENPSHIIASQDGVVRKMEVRSGIPMVKVGDAVKKGDILISGVIPIMTDYEELIRKDAVGADGTVYLESEFSYQTGFSMRYEEKKFKNRMTGMEIFWFDEKIFSYIPRYSEGKYDIMSIDIVPYAFDDYLVPILFRKYSVLQYDSETAAMTNQDGINKAKADWEAFLADWEEQGVQIVHAQHAPLIKQNFCRVTGTITACGNFISYQEIQSEEWKIEDEHRGNNP